MMSLQTIDAPQTLPILMPGDSPVETLRDRHFAFALLQQLLVFYQYLLDRSADGIFEAASDRAVRQFQHDPALYKDVGGI